MTRKERLLAWLNDKIYLGIGYDHPFDRSRQQTEDLKALHTWLRDNYDKAASLLIDDTLNDRPTTSSYERCREEKHRWLKQMVDDLNLAMEEYQDKGWGEIRVELDEGADAQTCGSFRIPAQAPSLKIFLEA